MRLILYMKKIIFLFIAFLFVICTRIISPFLILRFGVLDIGRIGGYYIADSYLSDKKHKKLKIRFLDIFLIIKSSTHINKTWLKMWNTKLKIIYSIQLGFHIRFFNKIIPGYEKHVIPKHPSEIGYKKLSKYFLKDKSRFNNHNKRLMNIFNSETPNLYFSKKDELIGIKALKKINIYKNKSYICFHNRDSSFLNKTNFKTDWNFHDYRDSDVTNYILSIEQLIKNGYSTIRMGHTVKKELNIKNLNFINYAGSNLRSDFLDIYLLKECKFLICSDTGISFPAEVFKRPIIYVNWTILDRLPTYVSNGLIIFKKFFSTKKKRVLSFNEMKEINLASGNPERILKEKGVKLIENTPQEIWAVVKEMKERLDKTWVDKNKNEILQEKFWELFSPRQTKSLNLRIGSKFLELNKEVLF